MLELDQWPTSRLLLTAARLVENAWNRELSESGLTYAGLTVLTALALHAHTKAELARTIQVQPQTIGRILDGLEHRGLIARIPTRFNQKKQLFALTPAGQHVLAHTVDTERRILPEDLLVAQKLRHLLQDLVTQLNRRR